jgi:sialidase-1
MSGRQNGTGRSTAATTRRVYQFTSSDQGMNWTQREITRSVKRKGWRWYATGPGHAIQISRGPYAGRLVVTGVHTRSPRGLDLGIEHKYSGTHSIISDDHGQTWRIGFVDDTYDGRVNTNETAVAQLDDGQLYFNSRDQFGTAPGNRAFGYSRTGGSSLSRRFVSAPLIAAPMVQCSVLGLADRLYFAGPSSLDGTRSRLTLRSTQDHGLSGRFGAQLMIWNRFAAYSDLIALSPSAIGVLYERGTTSPYDEIAFQTVSTGDLISLDR